MRSTTDIPRKPFAVIVVSINNYFYFGPAMNSGSGQGYE
jgi:hypothetical protein